MCFHRLQCEADWHTAGLRYYPLRLYLNAHFGGPVRKVSIDFGAGCPNRDGRAGFGGCVFCDPASFSPSRREAARSVSAQISAAVDASTLATKLLAYFQPGSNTYAPVAELRQRFCEAMNHPQVVGLAIGTRPDCLGEEVLDLLAELADRKWLSLELGLQSIHDATLEAIRRGHDYGVFLDAVDRARRRRLRLGAHVILGLPGEGPEEMIATAKELARLQIESVKIHNLYVAKDTPLADWLERGRVSLPRREEYAGWVVDFLEHLHPQTVIDRLSAGAPREYLVGPAWCLDKSGVLRAIDGELSRRDSRQGKKCQISPGT